MVRYVGRIADRHQGARARVHMSERDGGGLSSTNILFIILASLSGLVGAYWCYRRRKKRSAQTAPEEFATITATKPARCRGAENIAAESAISSGTRD